MSSGIVVLLGMQTGFGAFNEDHACCHDCCSVVLLSLFGVLCVLHGCFWSDLRAALRAPSG